MLDEWATKLSGCAGAIVSMRFLRGTMVERLCTAVAGAVASFYATAWMAVKLGMPEGLTGFLLGLFGMAVASRAWEWLQQFPVVEMWAAVLGRIKGGP